jgi:hypothetical protein
MHDDTTYRDGGHIWDIRSIREKAAGLQARRIEVDEIEGADTADWLAECVWRVQNCDPQEPVILGPDGQLLYGNYQVARAKLDGRSNVMAVRLSSMPEPVISIVNGK